MAGAGETGRPGRANRRSSRESAVLDLKAEHVADEPTSAAAPAGEPPVPEREPEAASTAGETAPVAEETVAANDAAPERSEALQPDEPVSDPSPAETPRVDEPTEEPVVVPPASAPPSREARAGRALAAGFAGGLLAAALAGAAVTMFGPLSDLGERLTAIETALGERATRRSLDAVEKRAGMVESAQGQLRADLDKIAARPLPQPVDLGPLNSRLAALERSVQDAASRAVAPAGGPAPAAPPPPRPAASETARLALAMLMRDSLSRGAPYSNELAALESAGGDAQAVAALRPFAASGAPTGAALAAEFTPLGERLAKPPETPPAGVLDRVTSTLSRVVTVRPVGQAPGQDPPALAARAEDALRHGDFAGALAALERLPERERQTIQSFLDRLRARVAAGQAADALLARGVDDVIAVLKTHGGPAR